MIELKLVIFIREKRFKIVVELQVIEPQRAQNGENRDHREDRGVVFALFADGGKATRLSKSDSGFSAGTVSLKFRIRNIVSLQPSTFEQDA